MPLAQDDMAINKTEWDQIRTIIRDALNEHEKGKLQRFKSWSPLGALVAIGLFVFLQWNAYTVFRTRTEDKLVEIEARLLKNEAARAPLAALNEIGKLPPKEFRAALPALRTVSERPAQEVKPDGTVLLAVSSRLSKTPETAPDYWATTLQFIQFATSSLHPDVPSGHLILPFLEIKARCSRACLRNRWCFSMEGTLAEI
jgi:hypothetical protein